MESTDRTDLEPHISHHRSYSNVEHESTIYSESGDTYDNPSYVSESLTYSRGNNGSSYRESMSQHVSTASQIRAEPKKYGQSEKIVRIPKAVVKPLVEVKLQSVHAPPRTRSKQVEIASLRNGWIQMQAPTSRKTDDMDDNEIVDLKRAEQPVARVRKQRSYDDLLREYKGVRPRALQMIVADE